jgi:hypothetical protein
LKQPYKKVGKKKIVNYWESIQQINFYSEFEKDSLKLYWFNEIAEKTFKKYSSRLYDKLKNMEQLNENEINEFMVLLLD